MKLLRVFFGVDMRNSHQGLLAVAAKSKVNLDKMGAGDCVIFINTNFTRVKMFASGTKAILYVSEGNKRIAPEAIKFLPHYVNGSELDYKGALAEAIEKHFKMRRKRT
jgi:hypothetical protein